MPPSHSAVRVLAWRLVPCQHLALARCLALRRRERLLPQAVSAQPLAVPLRLLVAGQAHLAVLPVGHRLVLPLSAPPVAAASGAVPRVVVVALVVVVVALVPPLAAAFAPHLVGPRPLEAVSKAVLVQAVALVVLV